MSPSLAVAESPQPGVAKRVPTRPLTHLFISREYPPAAYPLGGIGTYLRTMTTLLAKAGHTVHVIGQRWRQAPDARQVGFDGRLIVHRVALDTGGVESEVSGSPADAIARGMLASTFPSQAFSWQAALLAEQLIHREGIDVIEAQEWEAPLYYFQRRRALGLGPNRRPPCVVHLHSSTEQIFSANEWDRTVVDYAPAAAMEAYSIAEADALLCPSRFMAESAVARYGIDRSRITVVPYPLGDTTAVDRAAHTWASGSICHVGRLEPRKGVLEWADAIATVGAEHPDLMFDFVGSDTPLRASGGETVRDAIQHRVPRPMWRQLRFHGAVEPAAVLDRLRYAWASVVPSRWDNLPYSCLEAMSTGLPVIASPNGGMKELVEDGVSGWIAAGQAGAALAEALRRAIATPPETRAQLGRAAALTVQRVCDNHAVVTAHLDLKRRLVERGAPAPAEVIAGASSPLRVAVVLIGADETGAGGSVESLRVQTEPPRAIHTIAMHQRVSGDNDRLLEILGALDPMLIGVAFIHGDVQLVPESLAICRQIFEGHDGIGLVAAWTRTAGSQVSIQPDQETPYLGANGDVAPLVAVRWSALKQALSLCNPKQETPMSIFENVTRLGWSGLTYPAVLTATTRSRHTPRMRLRYSPIARAVQRTHTPLFTWLIESSSEDIRALVRQTIDRPIRAVSRFLGRAPRA